MVIIAYLLICFDSHYKLSPDINKKIMEGWQPFGGIAISGHAVVACQAMVKYKEK